MGFGLSLTAFDHGKLLTLHNVCSIRSWNLCQVHIKHYSITLITLHQVLRFGRIVIAKNTWKEYFWNLSRTSTVTGVEHMVFHCILSFDTAKNQPLLQSVTNQCTWIALFTVVKYNLRWMFTSCLGTIYIFYAGCCEHTNFMKYTSTMKSLKHLVSDMMTCNTISHLNKNVEIRIRIPNRGHIL